MFMNKLGKLRESDKEIILGTINIFKENKLGIGIHGTSLWNPKYKDVDMLAVSKTNNVQDFDKALKELLKQYKGKILEQKGDSTIGLDYDIKIGKLIVHLSFVILQ